MRYRVWLTPYAEEAEHTVDITDARGYGEAIAKALVRLKFTQQQIQSISAEELADPPPKPVVDTEDQEAKQSSMYKYHLDWLTQHGEEILTALHTLDPSLVCWWENFQNNVVVQVSKRESIWFGMGDVLDENWSGTVYDNERDKHIDNLDTDISSRSLLPWNIAQSLWQIIKTYQGRV